MGPILRQHSICFKILSDKLEIHRLDAQLQGYLNMAIGLGGIVLTILGAPHLIGLKTLIPTEKIEPNFGAFSESIRNFSATLVLLTFVFILALGMSLTLIPIASILGAEFPVPTAIFTVGTVFSIALTLTLAIRRVALWVPGLIGTLALGTFAFVTATQSDITLLGGFFGLFLVLFLISGVGALIAMHTD
jgi:hypothetical protein